MTTVAIPVAYIEKHSGLFQRTGADGSAAAQDDAFHQFEFQGKSRTIFRRMVKGVRQPVWSVKFEHQGKQVFHSTGKTSRKEAVAVAKLKIAAAAAGRVEALARSQARQRVAVAPLATMSRVLEVYRAGIQGRTKIAPGTVVSNISALRVMTRTALERELEKAGSADVCTPEVVKRFKEIRMKGGADGAAPVNVTTLNSTITQARAVFSKAALELYKDRGLRLPDTLPEFLKVRKFQNSQDVSFRPIPAETLARMEEDIVKQPAGVRLAYVLARRLGMRAKESLWARRGWIEDWASPSATPDQVGRGWRMAMIKRPGTEEHPGFKPKGRERRVPMTAAVREEILSLAAEDYLLPGRNKTERRAVVEREANGWIRKFLPDREKGMHELRKQAGSEIATRDGLMAARDWLGHASISTTEAHYATLLSPLRPL